MQNSPNHWVGAAMMIMAAVVVVVKVRGVVSSQFQSLLMRLLLARLRLLDSLMQLADFFHFYLHDPHYFDYSLVIHDLLMMSIMSLMYFDS